MGDWKASKTWGLRARVASAARGAWTRARAFGGDDSGQAITEYILLLMVTFTGAVMLSRGLLKLLDTITLHFGVELEKDLKTGRAPISVWKN